MMHANVVIHIQRLLHEGHKVLYKQLLGWVLQGKLFDPYHEFFVAQVAQGGTDEKKWAAVNAEQFSVICVD